MTSDETASQDDARSDLERELEKLLVGEVRIKVDPATGQVIAPDGEKSSLTESEEPHTIR